MVKNYPFSEAREFIESAQNILICLPRGVTLDQVAAGLSLFLSLSKTGKNVSIVSPELMTVGFSHLVGVDKVADKVAGGNLVLTIDAPIENIEKVSTSDDGQRLSLVIIPKTGVPPLTKEQIIFNHAGATLDLIITVGVERLENLGKIYEENQALFREKPIINLDKRPQNTNFGKLNILDTESPSYSEMVAAIIHDLILPIDEDISGNLLQGIREATNNFQNPRVSADTFEAAAFCLRMGGKKNLEPSVDGEKKTQAAPQDWFEPKIYKGSSIP